MKREELKEYLQMKNQEMLKSEHDFEREIVYRKEMLFVYSAGYAPRTTIKKVYDIIREVIDQEKDYGLHS